MKECALRARSGDVLVARVVVSLVVDAVVGLTLGLIAHVDVVVFVVAILHRIFCVWRLPLFMNCGISAVAVHAGRRHFLCCAEADFHGPCDHGDSPVTRGHGGRCPFFAVVQFPVVKQRLVPWSKLSVGPQGFSSCSTRCSMPCCAGRAGRRHPGSEAGRASSQCYGDSMTFARS